MSGQPMPLHPPPPPPFFYPTENTRWTEVSSNQIRRRNQVESPSVYDNRGRSATSRAPRRGILKKTGQWKTPTQRRMVHFMPERFQQRPAVLQSRDWTSREHSRRPVTAPGARNSTGQQHAVVTEHRHARSEKTPEKAHLDTIRRRERRQRHRIASHQDSEEELGRLNDNRFVLLTDTDEEGTGSDLSEADDDKAQAIQDKKHREAVHKQAKSNTDNSRKSAVSSNRQTRRTTAGVPRNSEHVVEPKSKARGNHQRPLLISHSESDQESIALGEDEAGNERSTLFKDKPKTKAYLQGFKILAYLKDRINKDRRIKIEIKDAYNDICAYAKSTVEAYDEWVRNHYETQVWQRFYDVGRRDGHWAKELVNITHTREARTNTAMCEKKIAHFTSVCFDANNTITRNMRELALDPGVPQANVVAKRAHDLMLDYIKEATQGLSKMSMNRIRRVSIEKDEWDALQAFEEVASEQQKGYARAYCKPALKSYQKKKKNFDLLAAHISHDVIP